jgi:RNA polymerase sigma-70 factor (ECF subfamily)
VDDLRLLGRARRGDENAFAELYERHRTPVFRYALHMCGRTAAEDVVQEVFLAFLRQLDRYQADRGTLQAYLLGIARRQALRSLTARNAEQWPDSVTSGSETAFGSAEPNPTVDPFLASSEAETVGRVRAAIATLPPAYREVVVLCELNDLDYQAAALVMNCPVGTVRSRLHRARAMLAARFAELNPRNNVAHVG